MHWFVLVTGYLCPDYSVVSSIKHRVRQTVKMLSFRSVWGWWSEMFFCFANPPTTNWQGVLQIKPISFDSAQDDGCTGRTSKTCTCEWPHDSNYQEHVAFHAQLYPFDLQNGCAGCDLASQENRLTSECCNGRLFSLFFLMFRNCHLEMCLGCRSEGVDLD